MSTHPYQIILTTCPDNETARGIAESLVAAGLAACVNILPAVQSVYRWRGNIETDDESLLLIKSGTGNFAAISQRIVELHPYELPEVIAVPIVDGLKEYLKWLDEPDKTQ